MATQREPRDTAGTMPEFAELTWMSLNAQCEAPAELFDPATLDALPPPARRLLARAVPPRTPLSRLVELDMDGEIRLGGRWLRFTARQILRAGRGFVWAPTVGGRVMRFSGADTLGSDGARIEFRLHGRIPIVRGSSDDIRRSARGRLAAETVAWLPQALTPQAGARWVGIDDHRAIVTLDAEGTETDVEISVDDDGRLVWLGLQRWNDSAKPPGNAPFGGSVDTILTTPDGVGIAGSGTVGWDWNTAREADGVFFRYRITNARFPAAPPHHIADRSEPNDADLVPGQRSPTAPPRSTPGSPAAGVDLYWIPVGAGSPVVQTSARIFEAISALRHRRPRVDLYHAALEVRLPDGRFTIEQAPVPDDDGAARGVVAVGSVGLRALGRLRIFRYEVRCWRDGTIPDLADAVAGPVRVSGDASAASRIIDVLPSIPTPVWGRDEARAGGMWNSNSVIAWVLTRSGLDANALHPPDDGRAPGWDVGCAVAGPVRNPVERPTGRVMTFDHGHPPPVPASARRSP